jgi:hypothetical protein
MKPRKPYPTDLSDKERELIQPYVPKGKPGGGPEKYAKCEILNSTFISCGVGVRGACCLMTSLLGRSCLTTFG